MASVLSLGYSLGAGGRLVASGFDTPTLNTALAAAITTVDADVTAVAADAVTIAGDATRLADATLTTHSGTLTTDTGTLSTDWTALKAAATAQAGAVNVDVLIQINSTIAPTIGMLRRIFNSALHQAQGAGFAP